jgi:creatinine amidohydrolase
MVESTIREGHKTKIILPTGSLEQHGPHLPLSTDTIIAEHIAEVVSEKCDTLLLPAIQVGCSMEHYGFPGTVSLQIETLGHVIEDITNSLLKCGLNRIFLINGHGGNKPIIDSTIAKLNNYLPEAHLYSFTIIDIAKQKFDEIRRSGRRLVGHADELETSLMLAINPGLVDMTKAVSETPSLPDALSFERDDLSKISFGWNAKDVTRSGIIGDPQLASAASGKILLDYITETISTAIRSL